MGPHPPTAAPGTGQAPGTSVGRVGRIGPRGANPTPSRRCKPREAHRRAVVGGIDGNQATSLRGEPSPVSGTSGGRSHRLTPHPDEQSSERLHTASTTTTPSTRATNPTNPVVGLTAARPERTTARAKSHHPHHHARDGPRLARPPPHGGRRQPDNATPKTCPDEQSPKRQPTASTTTTPTTRLCNPTNPVVGFCGTGEPAPLPGSATSRGSHGQHQGRQRSRGYRQRPRIGWSRHTPPPPHQRPPVG